jgi:putative CocE/NonD family hydrolase
VKVLIGPWNHTYPYDAVPGPAIEWRDQALRWWDHWLKGRDTGLTQEPPIAVYMQHWHPPDLNLNEIPGEWRNEARWPPPETEQQTLYLQSEHSLGASAGSSDKHELKYVPSAGVEAGFWWGDLTPDQRPVDAFSLVYDSPPLAEEKAILGRPKVYFRSSVTAPLANWFVRLCDKAPDGTVTLVTVPRWMARKENLHGTLPNLSPTGFTHSKLNSISHLGFSRVGTAFDWRSPTQCGRRCGPLRST